MLKDINKLLPLLKCPRSGTSLQRRGDNLVSDKGDVYPIIDGKPILVRTIQPFHLSPPEQASKNIDMFRPHSSHLNSDSVIIHLGSGNVPSDDSRVVSCDVLPCSNVDVVCEAEALPFQDNCVAYLVSGAVFEHVHNPLLAIQEVKRVLGPNGHFYIDTAFMQPYHGWPSHYFNMTSQAVESVLVGSFDLLHAEVPESGSPVKAFVLLAERFLDLVSKSLRERMLNTTLQSLLDEMNNETGRSSALHKDFDHYAQRSLAASYVVVARKQHDHDARLKAISSQSSLALDNYESLLRSYYATRFQLMQRHHEIVYYQRKSKEHLFDGEVAGPPLSLDEALARIKPKDMLDLDAIQAAIDTGRQLEQVFRQVRDTWIGVFLQSQAK